MRIILSTFIFMTLFSAMITAEELNFPQAEINHIKLVANTNGTIDVNWQCHKNAEEYIVSYKIERKTDSTKWTTLTTQGATGNNKYSFTDTSTYKGTTYSYRLLVVYVNGQTQSSPLGSTTSLQTIQPQSKSTNYSYSEIQSDTIPQFTVTFPDFSPEGYATDTPRQTGTAARAEITKTGLYDLGASYAATLYNFGKALPIFSANSSKLVFIRKHEDFYSKVNTVWSGALTIVGEPAVIGNSTDTDKEIPDSDCDMIIAKDGTAKRIFRQVGTNLNTIPYYSYSTEKPAPINYQYNINSYKLGTSEATKTKSFNVDSSTVNTSKEAICKLKLNWNGVAAPMDVKINNTTIKTIDSVQNPSGSITISYDSKLLIDGANTITLDSGLSSSVILSSITMTAIRQGSESSIVTFPIYLNNFSTHITLNAQHTKKDKTATLRVSLYCTSPSSSAQLFVNNTEVASGSWKKNGYRLLTAEFSSNLLQEGSNTVSIMTDSVARKYLDYVEIVAEVEESNDGYVMTESSLRVKTESGFSGDLKVKNALYSVDMSEFGEETLTELTNSTLLQVTGDKLLYFTDAVNPISFQPTQELKKIDLTDIGWLAIAPDKKGLWEALNVDDDGDNEPDLLKFHQEHNQLKTKAVKLEDIINTYGCGVFGPAGIVRLIKEDHPALKYLFLAAGTNTNYKLKDEPGIPTGMIDPRPFQLTASDDLYTKGYTIGVGRIPARSGKELKNWIDKAVHYTPKQKVSLMSGKNDPRYDFTAAMASHDKFLPTELIPAEGSHTLQTVTVNNKPVSNVMTDVLNDTENSIKAGSGLVMYQGHGNPELLSSSKAKPFHKNLTDRIPPSNWVLAGCYGGFYYRNYVTSLPHNLLIGHNFDDGNYDVDHLLVRKGAVNLIGCTTLGYASAENKMIGDILEYIKNNPDSTWGEVMNHIKLNMGTDNYTLQGYTLLGDPAMRAYPKAANRKDIVLSSPTSGQTISTAATNIQFSTSGTWPEIGTSLDKLEFQYRYNNGEWKPLRVTTIEEGSFNWDLTKLPESSDTYQIRILIDNYTGDTNTPTRVNTKTTWLVSDYFNIDNNLVRDMDSDNLADYWELKYYNSIDFTDGTGDSNFNGMTDLEEFTEKKDPVALTINLEKGWNLVSLPFNLTPEVLATFAANGIGNLWKWNAENSQYSELTTVNPLGGFWIYSDSDKQGITVTGTYPSGSIPWSSPGHDISTSAFKRTLQTGWNLLGASRRITLTAEKAAQLHTSSIYGWSSQNYSQIKSSTSNPPILVPGKGYWLHNSGDTVDIDIY